MSDQRKPSDRGRAQEKEAEPPRTIGELGRLLGGRPSPDAPAVEPGPDAHRDRPIAEAPDGDVDEGDAGVGGLPRPS